MNKEFVNAVGMSSPPTSIPAQDFAHTSARESHVRYVGVKRIHKLPPEPVYNMEVEKHHNLAVNGGLIVHNCIDAVRYALSTIWRRRGE